MNMVSEVVADRLGNTLVKVTMTTKNGKVTRKTVSLEDYVRLLNGSLKISKSYFRLKPGFLPENYIDGCFCDEKNYTCLWLEKAAVRQLVHSSGHYNVPFPDLVFLITVRNGVLGPRKVYVLGDDGEELYQYPFGNVSTGGSICTGNINIEGLDESVSVFSEEFFLGKTNNDYFHEGSHIVPKFSQEELLKRLDNKSRFPKRWLKRAQGDNGFGSSLTLSDLKKEVTKCQGKIA